MSDLLIQAKSISKKFGEFTAVDNINLELYKGEIFGLIGSDGAGKTTLIRLLVGVLRQNQGQITICGHDIVQEPDKAREHLGYLSQRFSLYEDMTVLENIRFFAELRSISSAEWYPRSLDILEFVGLSEFLHRLAGQLSGGMKQKLGLATALIHKPKLLLLDEPSSGVDPVTRQDFWQLIIRIVFEENVGVLISTPYMDEAARCTRIGIMQSGKLILGGKPEGIPDLLNGQILLLRGPDLRNLRSMTRSIPYVEDIHTYGDSLHVRVSKRRQKSTINAIRDMAKKEKLLITQLSASTAQLEDVFIYLLEQDQMQ